MGAQRFGNLTQGTDPQTYAQSIQALVFESRDQVKDVTLTKRSLIQWEVPHVNGGQTIEMYINPQNVTISSRKEINKVRTKGGYFTQYWGEDFDIIAIDGTTGSAAIEGINVLRDIYRSEQLALSKIVKQTADDKRRQSLMQLSASVVMWYQGQGYRGYFTDMSYTERADNFLIEYNLQFTVVEYLGQRRRNFLPWHRHPWSTSETPNNGTNQSTTGGGYRGGEKVGFLNIPCFTLAARNVLNVSNETTGVVQVAILRPDPKDNQGIRTDPKGNVVDHTVKDFPYSTIQYHIDSSLIPPREVPGVGRAVPSGSREFNNTDNLA